MFGKMKHREERLLFTEPVQAEVSGMVQCTYKNPGVAVIALPLVKNLKVSPWQSMWSAQWFVIASQSIPLIPALCKTAGSYIKKVHLLRSIQLFAST